MDLLLCACKHAAILLRVQHGTTMSLPPIPVTTQECAGYRTNLTQLLELVRNRMCGRGAQNVYGYPLRVEGGEGGHPFNRFLVGSTTQKPLLTLYFES